MKKVLYLLAILIGVSLSGFSQKKDTIKLSVGGELGIPVSSQIYGTVIGGSLKLELPVAKSETYITLTAGYSQYLKKLDYTGTADVKSQMNIPLEAGVKYYFSKYIYVEGDAGVSFNNNNVSASKTDLIYAPIIGVTPFTTHHKGWIDLSLRYEGESSGGVKQVAVRLAYRFKI